MRQLFIIGLLTVIGSSAASAAVCKSSNITRCVSPSFNETTIKVLQKRVGDTYRPSQSADILEVWKTYGKKYEGGVVAIYFKTPDPKAVGLALCNHEALAQYKESADPNTICFYIDVYKNDGKWPHGTGGEKIGHY